MKKLLDQISFRDVLTMFVVGCAMGFFYYVSGKQYATVQNNHVGEIKTAMISFVTMILGYHFGSSKQAGPSQKSDTPTSQTP